MTYTLETTFTGMSPELKKAESDIRKAQKAFRVLGVALRTINNEERKLYTERGFSTFEVYCQVVHDIDKRQAYRAMTASVVMEDLEAAGFKGSDLPSCEAQCRPLGVTELTAESRVIVWRTYLEAVKASKGTINSGGITTAVLHYLKPEEPKKKPEPTPEPTPETGGKTPEKAQDGTTNENGENLPFTPGENVPESIQGGTPASGTSDVKSALSGAGESVSELKVKLQLAQAENAKLKAELATLNGKCSSPATNKMFREALRLGLLALGAKITVPEHKSLLEDIRKTYEITY